MNNSLYFFSIHEVLILYKAQVTLFGGCYGVRDMGLLESALAMPQASFGGNFLHPDIYHMASAYMFHIIKNHPFLDGNKRTGTAVALSFLKVNGVNLSVETEVLVDVAIKIASSQLSKEDLALFFREHTAP